MVAEAPNVEQFSAQSFVEVRGVVVRDVVNVNRSCSIYVKLEERRRNLRDGIKCMRSAS